jgi:hypothetical protein
MGGAASSWPFARAPCRGLLNAGLYKRQLISKIENLGCGRKAAEGGIMTFGLTKKSITMRDPLGAGFQGNREFDDVSVSVRVPCGVGGVVALESFSRS